MKEAAPLVPNRPSPEGRELGEQLARLTDAAEPEIRKQFPNHAERCSSCAFRKGTMPNGCLVTVADALKCVVECVPFYCHHDLDANGNPTEFCAGWMITQSAMEDKHFPLAKLPYDFSEKP